MEALKEVEDIMKANEIIITNIASKNEVVVCSWDVEYKGTSFALTDKMLIKSVSDVLQSWKPTTPLTHIEDFFNDKLDYTLNTFEDVKRLNTSMWPVAKKYRLFGDSEAAREVLNSFKLNYTTLTVCLSKLEGMMADKPLSTIVQSKVKLINNALLELQGLGGVVLIPSVDDSVAGNTGVSGSVKESNSTGVSVDYGSAGVRSTGGVSVSSAGGTSFNSTSVGRANTGGSSVDYLSVGNDRVDELVEGDNFTIAGARASNERRGNSGTISPNIHIPNTTSTNNSNNSNSNSTSPSASPSSPNTGGSVSNDSPTSVKKNLKKKSTTETTTKGNKIKTDLVEYM